MDQIVNMIQERTGIDADKARTAADTVVGFLKDKLPSPLAGQIDSVIGGEGGGEGEGERSAMDSAADAFGGQRGNPLR